MLVPARTGRPRIRIWLAGVLLCVLVCVLAPSRAVAAPACPARPIKLALYEVGLYYHQGVGLDKDMADELQRRSGCRFDVVVMPRARIFREVEAGRLDIATSVLETPERTRWMWIADYIQLRYYAIIGPSVPPDVHSMEDFMKSRTTLQWSGVRGFSYGPYFDAMVKGLVESGRFYEVNDSGQIYKMLAAGRVAGTLATPMVYRHELPQQGLADKVRVEVWNSHEKPIPRAMGFSRLTFTEPEALAWMKLIDEMNRDGTTMKLIAKYLSATETADAAITP